VDAVPLHPEEEGVGGADAPGETTDAGEARARRGKKVLVLIGVVLLAAAGGYLLSKKVLHTDGVPAATPADVARAASINLRLTDLPQGFSENAPVPPWPPAVPVGRRVAALGTLARCLGQPRSSVQGWLGTGSFPGQITAVHSPVFGDPTVPTVQMYSTTALVVTSATTSSSLEGALGSPKFPACFGQFQVATLAVPATGQVQAVPLTAPAGVETYGYETLFTLADGSTETVGDAFMVGSGVVTLLQASTDGPSIPPEDFGPAFRAVSARVARASG
jgi:hypothetical protein